MAFDDWMERRWDRRGERHFRRERALENLHDKERRCKDWCQKIDLDMKKAKQDAKSILVSKDAKGCLEKECTSGNRKYKETWTDMSEESCKFPVANIFVIVPSKKSKAVNAAVAQIEFKVLKIYRGKPKWRQNHDPEVYGDEAGQFMAELFGKNCLTAYANECVVVYEDGEFCNGAYSDSQKEFVRRNCEEYKSMLGIEKDACEDTLFARLREEDLKDFILGSGVPYPTDAPYCESDDSDCESDFCDY